MHFIRKVNVNLDSVLGGLTAFKSVVLPVKIHSGYCHITLRLNFF